MSEIVRKTQAGTWNGDKEELDGKEFIKERTKTLLEVIHDGRPIIDAGVAEFVTQVYHQGRKDMYEKVFEVVNKKLPEIAMKAFEHVNKRLEERLWMKNSSRSKQKGYLSLWVRLRSAFRFLKKC